MLTTTIIAAGIAALSALIAWRSHQVSQQSAAEARRAADAAERSAVAAQQTARADAAADHRARAPKLEVKIKSRAGYGQGEIDAFYEITNIGSADLESVIVHRPVSDNGVCYSVAAVGESDYGDEAEVGPLPLASQTRFALAVGKWVEGERVPVLRIRLLCASDSGESWELTFELDPPRTPPARVARPTRIR